ncbi:holo-[acyl-carrier protein] synthase [Treponema bryantii]|jgi:holo-[acyl-carrier protein] synthase|uniref:Holo-[acyl-carrier-protein] synthase n=1 Tax=Treponema bryantii TaxID=163 RepID=A0A1I3ISK6_9SPIR|nr:holo-ACP synthase [Treponema bryantii]SFI50931.1 holo-[acyl-carrier protein] synthase [Treponema bryantii]
MIAGIGTDIAEVKRFEKWVDNPEMIERFFNEKEYSSAGSKAAKCQHYAVRFAAKEAFSKALGTGITGFGLKEVYITNDSEGKPLLNIEGSALSIMKERLGDCNAFVTLSHEKEYAVAFVILEKK